VKSPAVFVDRDGTIIEDVGYLSDPGRIRFIEGAEETIRRLRGAGFKVICVSNQSGVARGFFTEQKVREIHERLQALLRAGGAELDAIYYCPHHPDFGNDFYRKVCECRKPAIGMLKQAEAEHAIDMGKSFLVGDSPADILAGKEAGVKTILVKSGREENEKSTGEGEQEARPDFNAGTLLEAAKIILGEK
jgi:D-glycero-D-manno-heptose 1,7-bisphosphate phosphatase